MKAFLKTNFYILTGWSGFFIGSYFLFGNTGIGVLAMLFGLIQLIPTK